MTSLVAGHQVVVGEDDRTGDEFRGPTEAGNR
jgi:hypothetical protein